MTESTKEQPVLKEAPNTEETEVSAQEQAEALLRQLEQLNVNSPEKLENMAKASAESGNLARMLGQANDQIKGLSQQVQQLQNQPREQYYDQNEYGQQNNITPSSIRDELRRFYAEEVIAPQQEAQSRILGELSQIQGDADYATFASKWDEHFNTPQIQQRIYSGQSSPLIEYNNFKLNQFRNLLGQTTQTLKGLTEKGAKPIPHVEKGSESHVHTPDVDETRMENLKKMVDPKHWQGRDEDIESLVKEFFPKDDPLLGS